MSSIPPPPDVLDSAGGPPPPPSPRPRRSGLRRGLVAGGVVVLLGAAGAGAWAAYSFFQTGAQPAQALPASTLAYASIDLDPSGGQKIAALRTLNKFPAFKDADGISSDDDVRQKLFQAAQKDSGACRSLDYSRDIEPWLGQRAAIAAVDDGGKTPDVVAVLQVTDAGQADRGLTALKACTDASGAQERGEDFGWHVDGDWAVLADSDAIADQVAKAAGAGSLADDADYQKWTGETGDPGVISLYAAPAAGDYLAEHAGDLAGLPTDLGSVSTAAYTSSSSSTPAVPDELAQRLRGFQGLAVTIRFRDGGLEMAAAGQAQQGSADVVGATAADTVSTLPADTAAAFGLGLKAGWFTAVVDRIAPALGESSAELMASISQQTGLTLPGDAETLAGDSLAVSVSGDLDPSTVSADPSQVPVAVKVHGDADKIASVVGTLDSRATRDGAPEGLLGSSTDGESVAIGPDAAYRDQVAKDGGLGDDPTFRDVVTEADRADAIVFLDLDRFDDVLRKTLGADSDDYANLEPMRALGLSVWTDGAVSHAVVRVSTN